MGLRMGLWGAGSWDGQRGLWAGLRGVVHEGRGLSLAGWESKGSWSPAGILRFVVGFGG